MAITYNLGTAKQLSTTAALTGATAVTTGDQIVISGITKYDTLTFNTTITANIGVRVVNTNELEYTSDNGVTWIKIASIDGGDGRAMTVTFIETDANTLDITDVIANTVMKAVMFNTNTTTGTIADDRTITLEFNGSAIATDDTITVNMAGTTSADKIIYTATLPTTFDAGGTADDTLIIESGFGAVTLSSATNTAIDTFEIIDASAANSVVTLVMDSDFKTVTLGSVADIIQVAAATDMGTVTINGGTGRDTLELTGAGLTIAAADLAKLSSVEILKTAAGNNSITLGATDSIDTIDASVGVDNTIDASARTVSGAAIGDFDLKITTGTGNDTVTISQGKDDINLGTGNNILNITSANLTADDKIVSGAGTTDKIVLKATDTAITDIQLTGVTGFETLEGGAATTTVTLGDQAKETGITKVDVLASTGAATVDMVGMTADVVGMTVLGSANGLTIKTRAEHIGATDVFTGGAATTDVLEVATSGTITAVELAGVTLIEELKISATSGDVTVNIADANDFKTINSTGSTGHNTINASLELDVVGGITINTGIGNDTITTGATTTGVTINAGAGNNTVTVGAVANSVTTGTGNDTVNLVAGTDTLNLGAGENLVTVDYANFTVADSILGSGTNTLKFNDATTDDGTLTTVESKLVGGGGNKIDIIKLGADATQIVTLGANAKADGVVQVDGSALLTGHDLTVNLTAMDPTSGTFTVKGGAGDDTVKINSASLTATTSLQMGVADTVDTLEIGDVATIIDTDFTLSTSLEKLTFAIDGTHSITLGDKATAAGVRTIDTSMTVEAVPVAQVLASTIDLSSATTNADFTILSGKGADTIKMKGSHLTSADVITAGDGIDTLELSGVSNLLDAAFTGVTGVEKLKLGVGNNQSLVYSTEAKQAGILEIDGSLMGTGNSINVAAAGVMPLKITTGAGDDTIIMSDSATTVDAAFTINLGTGNNTIQTESAYLTSGDIIIGGAETDTLKITDAATLVDLSFGGMTNFEELILANGVNSVELGVKAKTAGLTTIDGSASASSLTATVTDTTFNITGGSAADTVKIASANLSSLTLNGAGGTDIIELTSAAGLTDASFANISNTETLKLQDFDNQTITLGSSSVVATNANNSGLSTIDGSGLLGVNKVTVDLSGVIKNMAVTTAGGNDVITMGRGVDTITTAGGDDTIKVTGELLQATDTINGGTTTEVLGDTLEITTTTTQITNALFANKTNLEILKLSSTSGTYDIVLGEATWAAGIREIFIIDGASANIDLSAVTSGAIKITKVGTTGNVTVTTGDEADNFVFGSGADTVKILSANLTSADTYSFGAGADILEVTDAATVIDADFTSVTGLETVKVGNFANTVTIGDVASTAGVNKVDLSNVTTSTNAQTVDLKDMLTDKAFTVIGGAGVDTIKMKAEDFTTADNLTGGGSTDILEFTTLAVGITDTDFTNTTAIETVKLIAGATTDTQSLTLGTEAFDSGNGLKTINGAAVAGKLTVNLTSASDVTITGGTAGTATTEVTMATASLTTADTITGGSGTADKLILNTVATSVGTSNFTGVTGVEILELQATTGAQSVVLGAGFTTVDAHTTDTAITIDGATTASLNLSNITTGSANDTLKIESGDFATGDTFAFGGGTDTLEISDTATVIDTDFTNVTGLETLKTTTNVTGQSVELSTLSIAAGVNKVDFTSVTNTAHTTTTDLSNMMTPSTLTVLGSAGADTIKIKAANLTTTDTFTGGTGTDIIELITAATVNLGSDNAVGGAGGAADSGFIDTNFTNVTGFETLKLIDGASQSLILGDKAFGLVSGGLTTVNATALTGTNSVSIDMTTATNDHNVTINTSVLGTGADTVTMKAAHLTTNDTIALGAGTADKLVLTTVATTLSETVFTGITGVEILELQATTGTQSVVLGAGFTTVDASVATDAVTIDGATTTSLDLSTVTTGTDNDTLKLQNADFTSTDVFAFGTGTDTLQIIDAMTILDADFTTVTELEVVKGGDFTGQSVIVGDYGIDAGVNKVDFSTVSSANTTSTDLSTTSKLADFTVLGGSGNDTVTMRTEMLMHNTQTVTAGSGTADKLALTTAATNLGAAKLAGVTGVEILELKATTGIQSVVLSAGFTTVDANVATANVTIDGATTTALNLSNVTTGSGDDTLKIQNGDFSSTDVFAFGTGTDTLEISDAATITDGQFALVTGVDVIKGGNFTGQSVILSELARVAGVTKVDFSGVTGTNTTSTNVSGMTTDITATILTGTGADTVTMRAADLTSADTLTDNGGADTLIFTTASTLADAAFTNVTGFETVQLANVAAQTIILGNEALGGGVRTLDADALTGTNAVSVNLSTATTNYDLTILTGASDDTVTMKAADLTSADTLTGNGGADKIVFTTGATLTDSAFTNVTGFETLELADGATQSLILGDEAFGLVSGGITTVNATALATTNAVSVDMSSATNDHNVTVNTSVAGTGADTVTMKAAHLTSTDVIALGAGTADKLALTTAATSVGVTAFTGVTGVEVLELQATAGAQSVVLGAEFTTVNASVATAAVTIDGATTTSLDLSTITTGTGDDTLKLQQDDFDVADIFAFGTGTDTLEITNAATITNAQFASKTGLDTLKLGNFVGQSVALGDLAIVAGVTKVDFSSITNTTYSTTTTLSGTADSTIKIIGGLGADSVTMRAEDLTLSDTLTGNDGTDTLTFSTTATLLDAAFTEVTGFETLVLADADAQTLVLGDQAFNGGSGIKTINGATLVTGTNAVSIDMSSATTDNAISITTGVGADTVTMKAAHLTSSDVLNGGAGNDTLAFTDAANLTADKFANVTSFKTLELQVTAGTQDVALVNGFDTVDATVATAAVTIDASTNGTTNLTITTGTGADTIKIIASTLDGSDDIEGGDGIDILEVIGVNNTTASITDAKVAQITHVETIKLTNPATPTSIVLGTNASANGINKVDASGTASVNSINLSAMTTAVEVVGGAGADSVTAAGITATNANNTIKTGLGDDTVTIDAQTLDSSDILWGEGGTDTLILTGDASGLTASDFTNVTGFESIKLSDGTGISMILGSDADLNNIVKVDASAINTVSDTITTDISGYEIVTDVDNFTYVGGDGVDTFKMQSTHLNKDDILSGGAGTADILEFTTVAISSTDSSIFNNVTGFETLKLADVAGAQTVTLKNGAFTTVDASANVNTGVITVDGSNVVGDITIKTAGGADVITAAKGINTIQSGAGNDTIKVNSTTFDADDIINGGDGTDTIEFSGSKTTITDAMFANKSNVESLKILVDESGQVITLAGTANTAGINTVNATTLADGTTALTKGITVDASGMTLGMTISTATGDDIIKAGNGADTIKAGNGADTITIAANKLNSSDVIWGEGGTTDTLVLTGVATLDDSAFTGVKTLESLEVGIGTGQTITMGANAILSAIKTIDTSKIGTGNTLSLDISAFDTLGVGGATKIIGGTGNETVTVKALTLDANDDINLGTGTDKVIFTDVLTSAPTLTKLTGVETIQLADGNNQTLTLNDDIGTTLTIDGTALVDINKVTIDGSTLGTKTTNFTVNTSTGADTITLGGSINAISAGGGDDTIKTAMANLTDADADTINGGSGTNTLEITTGGTLSDAKLLNVTNIQSVKLSPTVQADYNLTLGTNAGTNNIVNIDGSSLTTGKLSIDGSTLGNENVNFKGGDANDTFIIAGAQLNSSDTIDGKAATYTPTTEDTLIIKDGSSTATTIIDSAFTNLTNLEKLTYGESANHSLTAGDEFKASGIKTVDASALATTKTFAMNLDTMTTDMDLTVVGSNGTDTITMKGTHLTALDVLKLGTGANVLELSGAATLANANFAATSTGITTLKFTENYAQTLTIGANAITGGLATVDATAVLTAGSSITVDSAVTANLTINTGGGIDTITLAGGNTTVSAGAGDDIIKMTAANLTTDDVINGGAHTSKDILDITTAGTLADTQFAHVTNIEEIKLSDNTTNATQSLTFGANFTASGIVSVDASSLTGSNTLTLDISGMTSDKNMTILGGTGNDTVTILGSSLDKNDKIVFGSGTDTLKIASASTGTTDITDEDFTNISGVETVTFTQYHNTIEFGDNMVVAGVVKIDASGNTTTGYTTEVDMTNMSEVLSAYELKGGAGDDTFIINANQLVGANTKINGGSGTASNVDTLEFATSVVFDDAAKFAGVTNIETIKLADGDGQKIVLIDNLTSTLDGSSLTLTNSVEVVASALTSGVTITTNGGADTVTLGAGADTVTLGAGADTVTLVSANLTSADKIDFGTGTDSLILSTASELADSDFTNVVGLEKITLGNFVNSLTLGDFAKASSLQEVNGTASSSALTLDMSSMTSNIDLTVTAGSGNDTITMKGIHFQQTDNLNGGTGTDILAISGNSTIDDIAFTNSSNIETLKLLAGTHSVTLGTQAGQAGIVTIDTSLVGANNLSIDISAITTNMTITGQSGADTIIMGQGNDTVSTGAGDDTIKVASGYLTSADTVNGEGGTGDQLIFTTTISSTDKGIFGGVSNVEKLVLADGDGQKVTLKNGTFTTIDALSLSGSSAITIDAADVTTTDLKISTAGGDDIVVAGDTATSKYEVSTGAGDDTIQFTSSGMITSANDKIYGGTGTDILEFTSTSTASTIVDSTFFGTHITGIEILKLGNITGNSVALGAKATISGITTVDTTSVATGKDATINLSAMAINMTVNGGAGNDIVTAGTKNDTLNLGAGTDKVIITNAGLTAADIIDGGAGTDTIEISDASTVTDAVFVNVSNIEKLVLKGSAAKTVTLGENGDFSGLNEVDASTIGAVVVNINASNITGNFTITTASGADIITVGTGNITVDAGAGNDTIKIAGTTFDVNDTINGGAHTGTGDILLFTDAAILTDTELNKITNIETIKFSDVSGQSVVIGNNAKTNGLKIFDASAITSANSISMNLSSMGTDENMVLSGGAGKDTFIMQAAHFTATDTLAGGAGVDTLEFTTAVTSGTTFDDYFAKTTGIENIVLADFTAQTFTLGAKAQVAGVASVDATALTLTNSVTISASAITSALSVETAGGADSILAGSGLDSYILGSGNDTITFKSTSLNGDKVDGGEGSDLLIISDLANIVDASLANVSKIEKIKLSNAVGDSKITFGTFAQDAGILELDGSLLTGTSTINISNVTVDNFAITTGTGIDNITLGSGINTIVSGDGNDIITVRAEDFTSTDKINGGSDSDTLVISTASADTTVPNAIKVIDADFTNVTAIETIKLSNFANQNITLGINAKNAGITTLDATASGNITVDLSAIEVSSFTTNTGKGDDIITLGKANDVVNTGAGTDIVKIKNEDLTSLDTMNFGTDFLDTLEITDTATIIDEDFTLITGVDTLKVGNFASQTIKVGALASKANLDKIDASTVTSTIEIDASGFVPTTASKLSIQAGTVNDTIKLTSLNLNTNLILNGGTGTDTVQILDRANILDDKFTNFTAVEKVVLADFNNQVITLGAKATLSGLTTLDATALTTDSNTTINLTDFTSNLTLTGGAGDDTVTIKLANTSNSDVVSLGAGNDTLIIADAVTGNFNTWLGINGTGLASIENLKLSNLANQTLVLGANAKTLGITTVELTSTKGVSVTVDATSFASALTINTLDGNHTITTATGTYNDIIRTGLGVDTITLDAGDDDIYTGSGNDTINISTTNLTSADKLDGGLGIDTLALSGVDSTTHAVVDSMFDTLKGIEIIKLNTDASQKVTIGESARLAGVTTIDGSVAGTGFNLDASAFKGNLVATGSTNSDIITAGKGIDTITTGNSADTINFSSIYLNRYDKVDGGLGTDTLVISDKATITDDKFTSMKSIEVLKLGANVSGQTITLGAAAMKAGITTLDLRGIDGANYKVNTSAFTNPLEILVDRQGGTFVTSAKNDTLTIDAAVFHNTISFTAGLGSDTIKINTAATGSDLIIDDDFTKLVGVETLALTLGGEITLAPKAVLAGIRTLDLTNSTNATTVHAESFSNAGLNVILSQMTDTVTTGLNNDTITTTDANLTAADTINMGTQLTNGVDTVYITNTASITSAELNKISNAEVLKLGKATGHDVDFTGTTNTTMIKVDGTLMVAGQTSLVNVTGKTAQVEVLMGAGNDTVEMSKSDFGLYKTTLTQKTLNGGTGTDTILISDSATGIVDTDFIFKSKVLGFETIGLGAGGTVTIGANAAKAGITRVDVSTSSADSTILTGGITKAVTVTLGNNDDRVETGIGADTVNIEGANLDSNDKIWLGAGTDTLNILGDASGLDMTQMGGVINVETLKLSDATTVGQTVNISSAGFYFVTFDGTAMTTGSTIVDVHGMTAKTTVLLGKGADTVKMLNGDVVLTTKAINGGTGIDTLKITDAATLIDTNFGTKKIAAFETINLAGSLVAGANFVSTGISNIEASGALTFTSTAVTKGYTVTGSSATDTITLGSGADTIISVDGVDTIKAGGGNDTFKFEGNKLTATDTVWGEAGTDTIRFTSTIGTLVDAAFTLVDTVEKVVLEASTAQTLNYGDLAKAADITIIDANAVTAGFTLDSSTITGDVSLDIIGGSGNDTFKTKSLYLTNTDKFTGNGGTDTLAISDAATIIDTDFTYVKGVERITLVDAANSLTLGTQFQLSGITDIVATTTSTATNAIDMTGVSTVKAYNITGANGIDTITMKSAIFNATTTIDGNTGVDIITIADKAIITDAQFALKSEIETIKVGNFAGNSITLGALATTAGIVNVDGASMTSTTSTMTVNAIAMSSNATMALTGGAGNDIFMVTTDHLTTADTITGAGGSADKLIISGTGTALGDGDFTNVTGVETLAFATGSSYGVTFDAEAKGAGFTTVDASLLGTADVFTFTTTSGFDIAFTVKGGTGNDIITTTGATTNDIIIAGAGNDIITSGAGNDTLDGGLGNDKFVFANANLSSTDKITGGVGTDTIEISDAFTYSGQFALATGIETLSLKAASTVVVNTAMNKAGFTQIDASTSGGALNVDASATTVGLTIKGGTIADAILGSKGADTITGGTGADTFKFTTVTKGNGHDTITDFVDGTDKLSLYFTTTTDSALGTRVNGASLSETDFNYYITDINYTVNGLDVHADIVLLGGDIITLTNVTAGQITNADFFYSI